MRRLSWPFRFSSPRANALPQTICPVFTLRISRPAIPPPLCRCLSQPRPQLTSGCGVLMSQLLPALLRLHALEIPLQMDLEPPSIAIKPGQRYWQCVSLKESQALESQWSTKASRVTKCFATAPALAPWRDLTATSLANQECDGSSCLKVLTT